MAFIQGRALVASPYLTDPNFLRSVVYILRHDAEGALGLILNRPTAVTVGDLLGQLTESDFRNEALVYCGGPVDGPLVMLQNEQADADCMLSVVSDQDRIVDACQCGGTESYRLFDGYAGWGSGQLEAEMESGGWLIWDIPPSEIINNDDKLWEMAVRQIGRDILAGSIDPTRMPEDPAFN